jgi:hypothetical protein
MAQWVLLSEWLSMGAKRFIDMFFHVYDLNSKCLALNQSASRSGFCWVARLGKKSSLTVGSSRKKLSQLWPRGDDALLALDANVYLLDSLGWAHIHRQSQ